MVSLTREALLVHDSLLFQGIETPFLIRSSANRIDDKAREERIIEHVFAIMDLLNLDLTNDSLINTPKRIARMYIQEFFYGLNYANFPKITFFKNVMKIDEMILVRDISVLSICEHHFVIFNGIATVAYIPEEYIIGLSKINRIVDFFSKRPQVQERLTQQILLALQVLLGTKNVAISIGAVHFCVKARGICDNTSNTVTFSLGGMFKSDKHIRQEFVKKISSFPPS